MVKKRSIQICLVLSINLLLAVVRKEEEPDIVLFSSPGVLLLQCVYNLHIYILREIVINIEKTKTVCPKKKETQIIFLARTVSAGVVYYSYKMPHLLYQYSIYL